jgi:hypothetical protein
VPLGAGISPRENLLESMPRVPAAAIDVMSLQVSEFVGPVAKPGMTIPVRPRLLITTS